MRRNVEVKVRLEEGASERLRARLLEIGAEDRGILKQDDIFFRCLEGRLKLRRESSPDRSRAELIFYRRPYENGPKVSEYLIAASGEPGALERMLEAALGIAGRVIKERRLFLQGRTRIHLDRIEGLGEFLELEVVLADGEDPQGGRIEAEALLAELGIADARRLEGSYLDLVSDD